MWRRILTVMCFIPLLASCAGTLPPALPDAPTAADQAQDQPDGPLPPLPAPTGPPPVTLNHEIPPLPPPLPPAVVRQPPARGGRGAVSRTPALSPHTVIDQANTAARVAPSTSGYGYGSSTSQRYPWWPGRLFEVYTAPAHPTTVRLPPGELLAKGFAPTLNPELWNVGVVEQGDGEQAFHAIIIRPVAPGQEATTPLLLRSGKALYCRIRSFDRTSMVEVTWDAPLALSPPARPMAPPPAAPANAHAVTIAPAPPATLRPHTAYTIAVQGAATPPWRPLRVWDDGTTTYILFSQNLQFTNAPGVFVQTQRRGPPQIAQFTVAPPQPGGATTYLIRGLWPLIELTGDGMTVTIRREDTPKVSQNVAPLAGPPRVSPVVVPPPGTAASAELVARVETARSASRNTAALPVGEHG